MSARPPIPVNLIAGPLGVGKTTTINHLLAQRPAGERWAVLVNEYGLVGMDAALMEQPLVPGQPQGVEIREVAGGCICCSAGVVFEMSLVLLLRRRPDRLLIEPTGLAALSGILDTLDRDGIRGSVDVRSVVCLLDPERLDEALARQEVQDQVQAADVLLANRSDLASPAALAAFDAWAGALFPPKRHVGRVVRGALPLELLDLVANRAGAVPRGGHAHGTDHHHHHEHPPRADHASAADPPPAPLDAERPILARSHRSTDTSTIGWICWSGLVFDAERVASWLRELAGLPGARRLKAVLRTDRGWTSINIADGVEETLRSGYRRDSRLELVIEGAPPDAAELERGLRACLVSDPP